VKVWQFDSHLALAVKQASLCSQANIAFAIVNVQFEIRNNKLRTALGYFMPRLHMQV